MRLTRVYVDEPVTAGKRLVIEGSAANRIARVLRLRSGDRLIVFNGSGGEFGARIEDINAVEAYLSTIPGHAYPNVRRPIRRRPSCKRHY